MPSCGHLLLFGSCIFALLRLNSNYDLPDKRDLYCRSFHQKFLEFCAYYEIAIAAVDAEGTGMLFCQAAHFLHTDIEIGRSFLDRQGVLFV